MERYALIYLSDNEINYSYKILGRFVIEYIVDEMIKTNIVQIFCLGVETEEVRTVLKRKENICEDIELNDKTKNTFTKNGSTIIIPFNYPLITQEVIEKLFEEHENQNKKITNFKVNENENSGIYIVNNGVLYDIFNKYNNKYEIKDIINLLKEDSNSQSIEIKNSIEFERLTDFHSISFIEKYIRNLINIKHMKNGVHIMSPETVIINNDVKIDKEVIIYPNTIITGNSQIKKKSIVGPNTEIHNSVIGVNSVVKHSFVINSNIGNNSKIGPFSHLRDNATIKDNVSVGNYSEIKNSTIGNFTKVAHLSFVGDSIVGENVNFGAGSITVNYDGINKHMSYIGDNAFIGCNVSLIAPIKVEKNTIVAAGSTITDDVKSGSMAIARKRQINKDGYANKIIKFKSDK